MKKLIKAFGRGVIKTLPLGSAVVETAQNLKASKENATNISNTKLPHSWVSIVSQILVWGVLAYAFYHGTISVDQIINYLK